MKTKIAFVISFFMFFVVIMSGCSSTKVEEPTVTKHMDNGYIISLDTLGKRVLITEQPDATWYAITQDTVLLGDNQASLSFDDLQIGQKVATWFLGAIAESYPSQTTAAKIMVIDDQYSEVISQAIKELSEQKIYFIQKIEQDTTNNSWSITIVDDQQQEYNIVIGSKEPVLEEAPVDPTHQILAENQAFRIFEPGPNTMVGNKFIVRGEARVFEAAFSYTLEDGHNILSSGHVYADKGAPEWGGFEFEVTFDQATSPSGLLIIYESSAKDGSPVNVLQVPVTFQEQVIKLNH